MLEMIVIFLVFFAITFKINNGKTEWLWSNYPVVAINLILTALCIALIWIRIEKRKVQSVISEIQKNISEKPSGPENKLNELSVKQKEVFDLIIQGKSNKEIISELVIELSTLKTHINQIYKKLEIKNRREAQSIGKLIKKEE